MKFMTCIFLQKNLYEDFLESLKKNNSKREKNIQINSVRQSSLKISLRVIDDIRYFTQ